MAFKPKFRTLVVAAALALGYAAPAAAEPVSLITLVAMKLAADYAIAIAIGGMLVSSVINRRKQKKAAANQKSDYNAGLTERTATMLSEEMPLTTIYGQPGGLGGAVAAMFTHGAKDEFKSVVVVYAAHACTEFLGCFLDGDSVGNIGPDGWVVDGPFAGERKDTYFDQNLNFDANGNAQINGTLNSASLVMYPDSPVTMTYPSDTTTIVHVEDFIGAVNATNIRVTGNYTTFDSKLRVRVKISGDGAHDSQLMGDSGGLWTMDHKLTGMTYIIYTFNLHEPKFQSGFPAITARFKGKAVFDPRTGQTAYSRNNALCLADFLRSPYGFNADQDAINLNSWISAANACDEIFYSNPVDDYGYQLGYTNVRYTCDGAFNTKQEREAVRQDLEESMAGACYESGGVWVMKAGVWSAPVLDLLDKDLLAPVQVSQSAYPGNERFNSIRISYVNAAGVAAGVADDAPPYQNLDLIALDDNEERWDDMAAPFTSSQMRATQLGRIRVEKSRGGLIIVVTPKMVFWKLQPGDRIRLTDSTLGINTKTFRVQDWIQSDTGPMSFTAVEDVPDFYDLADLTQQDPAPNTNFPDPFARPAPPVNLAAESGPDQMLVTGNSVTPRVHVTWLQSNDVYVTVGGRTVVSWRLSSVDDDWKDTVLSGEATETFLLDAPTGAPLSIRNRFVSSTNRESEWTLIGHTVQGLPESMAPGTNFNATIQPEGIIANWDSPEGVYGAAWFESQVRVGAPGGAWADASVLWTGKAVKANLGWLIAGNRVLMLAHRKVDSDWSAPVTKNITIRSPGELNVVASEGYGTASALWNDPTTDQPISFYDVRRALPTVAFASADKVAQVKTLRYDFNEPMLGRFKYFVQAVDMAGNVSTIGQDIVDMLGVGVPGGDVLPATGADGNYFYLKSTKVLYAWDVTGTRWAPIGVQKGTALPAVAASGEGDTYILDGVMYRFKSGAWVIATIGVAQFAAGLSPVKIVTTLPTVKDTEVVSLNGVLYSWNIAAGAYTGTIATVADGSIDITKIASTLEVPMNYAGVPTTRQASDVIFNTNNSQIYRWSTTTNSYVNNVDTSSLLGQIQTAQIALGAITADVMATGNEIVKPVSTLPTTKQNNVAAVSLAGVLYTWDTTTNKYSAAIQTGNLVGTIATAQIATNAITAAKMAVGLEPVTIATGTLPTVKSTALITFNNDLYRWDTVTAKYIKNFQAADMLGTVVNTQIAGVDASKIAGQLADAQIATIAANKVAGQLADTQIAAVSASKISGQLVDAQIAAIAATKMTGQLADSQIGAMASSKLVGTIVNNQIDTVAAVKISGTITDTQIAAISAVKITGTVADTQIAAVSAVKISGTIADTQIAAVSAAKVTGTLNDSQLANISATKLVGQVTSAQITALDASKLTGSIPDAVLSIGGSNMLINGGFEDALANGNPTGWYSENTAEINSNNASKIANITAYGKQAQRLTFNAATAGGFVSVIQLIPCNVGVRYVSQIKIRASVAGIVALYAQVLNNGTVVTTPSMSANMAASSAFTRFSLPIPATAAGTTQLRLYYRFFPSVVANGITVDYDEAQVEEGSVPSAFAPRPGEILDGSVTSANIADAAISLAKFAAGTQPVTVVAGTVVPTVKSTDVITVNGVLYRWNATSYVKSVASSDISGLITDAQLAAMAASKITGQLTDGQLSAISAAKVAGQITGTQITDGAISTVKMQAGSVSANILAANAVTAGKLAIGDFQNFVTNGNGASTEGWGGAVTSSVDPGWATWWNALGEAGYGVLTIRQRDTYYGPEFPVKLNDQFWAKYLSVTTGGGAAQCNSSLGLALLDANHVVTDWFSIATRPAGTVGGYKAIGARQILNPAAAFARVWFQIDATVANAALDGYAMHTVNHEIRRKNGGELIVDGAITANLVLAGAITAGKIAANAIIADNIQAGAITAGKLDVNSVTAANLQAGIISADKIAAGAITADKLSVVQQEPSLVMNPSFEDGMTGWSMTAYAGNNAPWAWADGGSDGVKCFYMGRQSATQRACLISKAMAITPGAQYVLRYRYYVNSGGARAQMLPYVFQHPTLPDGGFIPYPGAAYTDILTPGGMIVAPTGSWQTYEAVFTTRTDCKFLSIAIHSWDSIWEGDVYLHLDEFSMRKTITSAFIADGAITTDKLVALAVVAGKIAAGAVNADNIQANSIQTGHLGANSVNADKIAANSIYAAAIQAGVITGDKIAANTLTANNIIAGAIGAREIAANAITAKQLAIADFENIITNGTGVNTDGWSANVVSSYDPANWSSWWNPLGESGFYSLNFSLRNNSFGTWFRVKTGDEFYAKFLSVPFGGGASQCNFGLGFILTDDAGGGAIFPMVANRPAGTVGGYKAEGSIVIPAGYSRAQIFVLVNASDADAGKQGFGHHSANFEMRRKNTGKLIVDGAITANLVASNAIIAGKIAANAITAGTIAANAVTAGTIVAGSITANELAANSVTANQIAANSVTSVDIQANSIQTGHIVAGAVTANSIAANSVYAAALQAGSVNADKIAANSITAQMMQANSVQAGAILAGAIVAGKLSSSSVSTDNLQASAITADKVAANSISTGALQANAVTAGKIAANAVTANTIVAGAIGAREIAANAITAKSLAVTDFENLVTNGAGWSTEGWDTQDSTFTAGPGWAAPWWNNIGSGTDTAFTMSRRDQFFGAPIIVKGGDQFYASFISVPQGADTAYPWDFLVGLAVYNPAGQVIQWMGIANRRAGTSPALAFTEGATYVSNNLASYARVWVSIQNQDPNYNFVGHGMHFSDIQIRRKNTGKLIVDGAISANLVAANAITAGAIAAGSIVAGKIATNAVTADNIQANAITAGKVDALAITTRELAVGSVTADRVGANAIIAGKIAANAITAGTIAANAVTAGTIAALAVTAGTVAANAITATEIAANAITTAKIAANQVTATQIATDAVTAVKIQANSIDSGKIQANAIIAGKIAGGAVTADTIAASAITAEKLSIGAFSDNLLSNGSFEDGMSSMSVGASNVPGQTYAVNVSPTGSNQGMYEGQNVCRLSRYATGEEQQVVTRAVPVTPGQNYRFRMAYRSLNGRAIGFHLAVGYSPRKAGYIDNGTAGANGGIWAALSSFNAVTITNTDWAIYEAVFTIPDGMYWASFAPHSWSFPAPWQGECHMDIDDLSLKKLIVGTMIAENAITTGKIQAGSISADKLIVQSIGSTLNSDPFFQDIANSSWFNKATGFTAPDIVVVGDAPVGTRVASASLRPARAESIRFPIKSGGQYCVSAWWRSFSGANGVGFLRANRFNAAGAQLGFSIGFESVNPINDGVWRYHQFLFTAEPGAVTGWLDMHLNWSSGNAGAWQIAGFKWEEVLPGTLIQDGAITTAKIVANAITADQIAANSVIAGKIASGAVTADTIAANSIATNKLQAGSVVSTTIASGSITAVNMAANSIATVNLQASAITADKMAVNSVTAATIVAGAIGAREIAANAITTDKLNVTQQEPSLIMNPSFEDGMTGWSMTAYANNNAPWAWTTGGSDGTYCMYIGRTDPAHKACVISKAVAITPGGTYTLRFKYLVNSGGARANFLPYVFQHGSLPDGGFIPYPGAAYVDILPGAGLVGPRGWTVYETVFTTRADCKYLSIAIHNWEGVWEGAVFLHLDEFSLRKQINSASIADGAITTPKLIANVITANELAANSVTAAKIVVGAIGADQIAAKAITVAKLAVTPDLENFINDGGELASGWINGVTQDVTNDQGWYDTWWNPLGVTSKNSLRVSARDSFYGTRFNIKNGDSFYAAFPSVPTGGGASQANYSLGLTVFNVNNQVVGYAAIATRPAGAVGGYYATGTWKCNFPGAATAHIWFQLDASPADAARTDGFSFYFTKPIFRRQNDAELIVNGAITGDKIAANSVDTVNLRAGAVTAGTIASNAITTEKIAAGAVVANSIAASSITTDRIGAGQILAVNIGTNQIYAQHMGVGSITAQNAAIASAAIQTLSVAGQAITVPAFNGQPGYNDIYLNYYIPGVDGETYSVYLQCSMSITFSSQMILDKSYDGQNWTRVFVQVPGSGQLASMGIVQYEGSNKAIYFRLYSPDGRNNNYSSIYAIATKR